VSTRTAIRISPRATATGAGRRRFVLAPDGPTEIVKAPRIHRRPADWPRCYRRLSDDPTPGPSVHRETESMARSTTSAFGSTEQRVHARNAGYSNVLRPKLNGGWGWKIHKFHRTRPSPDGMGTLHPKSMRVDAAAVPSSSSNASTANLESSIDPGYGAVVSLSILRRRSTGSRPALSRKLLAFQARRFAASIARRMRGLPATRAYPPKSPRRGHSAAPRESFSSAAPDGGFYVSPGCGILSSHCDRGTRLSIDWGRGTIARALRRSKRFRTRTNTLAEDRAWANPRALSKVLTTSTGNGRRFAGPPSAVLVWGASRKERPADHGFPNTTPTRPRRAVFSMTTSRWRQKANYWRLYSIGPASRVFGLSRMRTRNARLHRKAHLKQCRRWDSSRRRPPAGTRGVFREPDTCSGAETRPSRKAAEPRQFTYTGNCPLRGRWRGHAMRFLVSYAKTAHPEGAALRDPARRSNASRTRRSTSRWSAAKTRTRKRNRCTRLCTRLTRGPSILQIDWVGTANEGAATKRRNPVSKARIAPAAFACAGGACFGHRVFRSIGGSKQRVRNCAESP